MNTVARMLAGCLSLACLMFAGCATSAKPVAGKGYPLDQPVQTANWQFGPVQGKMLDTPHYRIFTTSESATIRTTIGGFFEACYANYSSLTGLTASGHEAPHGSAATSAPAELYNTGLTGNKLPVYLLSTRKQWAALTEKVTGKNAETFLKVSSGGYCYDGVCVFWDLGPLGTYSVASHEGLHQFLHFATRQSLPSWAEEGLATQAEGFAVRNGKVFFAPGENVVRYSDLRKAIIGRRFRTASQLVNMDAAENVRNSFMTGGEYYAQLWAMLLLIRTDEKYAGGCQRMLSDAAAGTMLQALQIPPAGLAQLRRNGQLYNQVISPRAFEHYIESDMPAFERRYEQFARELAGLK